MEGSGTRGRASPTQACAAVSTNRVLAFRGKLPTSAFKDPITETIRQYFSRDQHNVTFLFSLIRNSCFHTLFLGSTILFFFK